jgi:hypothetical protein
MKNRTALVISFFFLCILTLGFILPAQAAPPAQGFVTATAGADGRILYTVIEGDNCSAVAFRHGITVAQLRSYNPRLDSNCTLSPGQQLVVGLVQPETGPTPGALPTPTTPATTSTPFNGTTEICVLLFDDTNGDALRQETELGIDGGAVSVTNLNGSYSETQNTSAGIDPTTEEPVRACFKDVPPGDYNVSMAVPDGYNPTTLLTFKISVESGNLASVGFGAQPKSETTVAPVEPEANRSSPLGWFGLLLLLGGLGLGYYAYRSNQPDSKLKGSPLDKR